ncbi:MAG: VCBS repeat-containing protein [Pirellulaceae bacterium]
MRRITVFFCLWFWTTGLAQSPALDVHHLDNPASDGWHTEAFTRQVEAQLAEISAFLIHSNAPDTRPPDIAVSQPSIRSFDRSQMASVFDNAGLAVRRPASPAKQPDAASFIEFLRQLRDDSFTQAKFKVVSVEIKGDTATTRILATLIRHSSADHVEQNMTWQVGWQIGSNDALPMIQSIHELTLEISSRNSSNTLFLDRTPVLFQDAVSTTSQLVNGQPYWLRRIEQHHGMYNPAQNGIAVADVNGDQRDDVYVLQPGGLPNRLFLQQADGTLKDVSAESGLDVLDNSHAALFVDLDNDADQDVIVTTRDAVLVFHNTKQATFELVQAIPEIADAYSLAAADFNKDRFLDVYVTAYFDTSADRGALPVPVPYFDAKNGGRNVLLQNTGRGQFADATKAVGLDENNHRFSYSAIWLDFDQDGDADLYVANDFGPDSLFRHDRSNQTSHFTEVSNVLGLPPGAFGMSASAGDYDQDGWEDIYVANMFSSAGNRIATQPAFRPEATSQQKAAFQKLAAGNSLLMSYQGQRFHEVAADANVAMGRWG